MTYRRPEGYETNTGIGALLLQVPDLMLSRSLHGVEPRYETTGYSSIAVRVIDL